MLRRQQTSIKVTCYMSTTGIIRPSRPVKFDVRVQYYAAIQRSMAEMECSTASKSDSPSIGQDIVKLPCPVIGTL